VTTGINYSTVDVMILIIDSEISSARVCHLYPMVPLWDL
jgi:hypothetical protein